MFKKIIFSLIMSALLLPITINIASAQNVGDALTGLNNTAKNVTAFKSQVNKTYNEAFIQTRLGQIIGIVLSFVGVIFLILMIYAGILWMTASGNEKQTGKAKDLIISAVIGLVIVMAAYAATNFIGTELSK